MIDFEKQNFRHATFVTPKVGKIFVKVPGEKLRPAEQRDPAEMS